MEVHGTDIAWIVLCILASAFFSGAETALTSISALRLSKLVEEGGPGRRILKLWEARPNRVLTAILLGNNAVNMLASGLATSVASKLLPGDLGGGVSGTALAYAVGLMTLLVLMFGEIFPKTFAKHNAERFLLLGPLIVAIYYLLLPATAVFVRISRGVARLVGAKITTDGPMVRSEDIEHLVKLGAETRSIDRDEARYLSGILGLSDTVAREVMVPRTEVTAIELASSLETVLEIVAKDRFSRYPVYTDQIDEIVGVLYTKDLLELLSNGGPEDFSLGTLMREPVFVAESRSIADLLKDFREKKVHLAIVVDEFGGTSGIITLEDVIEEMTPPCDRWATGATSSTGARRSATWSTPWAWSSPRTSTTTPSRAT